MVCVLADRAGAKLVRRSPASGRATRAGDARERSSYAGEAPIVFAGSGQTGLIEVLAREAGVRGTRLIGSASEIARLGLTRWWPWRLGARRPRSA